MSACLNWLKHRKYKMVTAEQFGNLKYLAVLALLARPRFNVRRSEQAKFSGVGATLTFYSRRIRCVPRWLLQHEDAQQKTVAESTAPIDSTSDA